MEREAPVQAGLRLDDACSGYEGEKSQSDDGVRYDEFFKNYGTNPFVDSEDDALSTFAVDVDTGSFTKARNYINNGSLPPEAAVRVEEFVNYMDYGYEGPTEDAFKIHMAMAPSRYGKDLKNAWLLRVGMQAKRIDPADRKDSVLTFVVDVSGSMDLDNRLGLVKRSLRKLVKQLRDGDKIGLVVYGSRGRVVLEPTGNRGEVIEALDELYADGSTYAEEGIRMGYELAAKYYKKGAINRVILCSDGVANVGNTGPKTILKTVTDYRRKGITLTTVGFGMDNYNDVLMEQLGDKGDGHYAYVDSDEEAERVFVQNLTGTLQVVARDSKVQVAFNPDVVKSWRLLGYENRDVADEDFRNDSVDGGEVGAGHSVTALFEIKLAAGAVGDVATATVRWKHDERDEFRELESTLTTSDASQTWEDADTNLRLAANVAEFAELLRKSYWAKKGASYESVVTDLKDLIALTDRDDVLDLTSLVSKARKLNDEANRTGIAGGE